MSATYKHIFQQLPDSSIYMSLRGSIFGLIMSPIFFLVSVYVSENIYNKNECSVYEEHFKRRVHLLSSAVIFHHWNVL